MRQSLPGTWIRILCLFSPLRRLWPSAVDLTKEQYESLGQGTTGSCETKGPLKKGVLQHQRLSNSTGPLASLKAAGKSDVDAPLLHNRSDEKQR